MEIKAVLFDMDGVLIDSEPANLKQFYEFYKTQGVEASKEFLISLVGSSIEYTGVESVRLLNNGWSVKEFYEHFDEYAKQYPISFPEILNEGVKETLLWLKEHGYQTAIGSSSQMSIIERMLKECELESYFDVVFSGEMFKESKPNPEIYESIAKTLGVEKKHCIVIEDSGFGIEAGKRANMVTIALRDDRFGIDQSGADEFIEDMKEIPAIVRKLEKSV